MGASEADRGVHAGDAAYFLDVLRSRHSVAPKRLIAPGPSTAQLAAIVSAGFSAPDHCLLRPWRFVGIPNGKRAALGELFAHEKREWQPDAPEVEIEAERLRALNAPTLLAVLIEIVADHPKVPVEEQYISLGAAIENILLAAHALGFGAMLTSGRKVRSPLLRQAFCRAPSQHLVGFISIGTAASPPKSRTPMELADYFTEWRW